MTFSSCEDHCAILGGTVACVTSDADETALDALRAEAACGQVWVGFNDADGDGAWGWPAGCSSVREYGECDGGLCEYHDLDDDEEMCVTLNRDVAECSEISQCCACSISTPKPTPKPTPQPTPGGNGGAGSSGGNGGADAASAGIIGGAVAGVAVLAAIGVGAYVYMRSKNSADSTQLAEVQLVGSADEAALPKAVASAPPLMPPPPPTGRNFCSACGAPLQGSFCSQCGARA